MVKDRAGQCKTAVLALGVGCLLGSARGPGLSGQDAPSPMTASELLSIRSTLGGGTPRWSPVSDQILLGGSSLRLLDSASGTLMEVPLALGGSGHFLASSEPRWSPTGEWISYVSDKRGTPEIWIWSPSERRDVRLTGHGGRLIKGYSWSPDGAWIAFAGNRNGQYDIWIVEVSSGATRRLTQDPSLDVFPSWSADSRSVVFVRMDQAWMNHEILEVELDGGTPRTIVRDTAFFDYGEGATFGHPLISPDGGSVVFPSYRSGWINYWAVPFEGGDPRPLAAAEADQSEGVWSPRGEEFAYIETHDGTSRLRIASASGDTRTVVAPESGVITGPGWSSDGTRVSYLLETPTEPTGLFVYSLVDNTTERRAGPEVEEVHRDRLVAPERTIYQGEGGLEIPSYVYRPPSGTADPQGRHPAIVWTHGGPTSQWADTYEPSIQYFVQRGYVVLLPNIRGSSGYGRAFEEANDGCWGKCDFADVARAAQYLRTLPYVQPDQIGTTGTSYGGFMSCAAATFGGEAFQAVIAASGYCDRVTFFADGEFRHLQQLRKEMGGLEENRARYLQNSPYYHVADVTVPVFVLHGDGRYPSSPQMTEFFAELQRLYKPARYKMYPGENFYVSSTENTIAMLRDMEAFFGFYLLGRDTELPGVAHLEELNDPH